jgi:hypothetical protein
MVQPAAAEAASSTQFLIQMLPKLKQKETKLPRKLKMQPRGLSKVEMISWTLALVLEAHLRKGRVKIYKKTNGGRKKIEGCRIPSGLGSRRCLELVWRWVGQDSSQEIIIYKIKKLTK